MGMVEIDADRLLDDIELALKRLREDGQTNCFAVLHRMRSEARELAEIHESAKENLKPASVAPGIREFETGAVRSSDADSVRYDLITPIGLAAVAEIYNEGFDDEFLDPNLTVENWLGYAKKFTYNFLAGGSKADLAMGAVCVLEAIGCEARGNSDSVQDDHDERGCGYERIPVAGLRAVAEAYAEGAIKYAPYNWEAGMPVSDLLNHGLRHVDRELEGSDDPTELGHAGWNWLAALHSLALWPHLNTDLRGPGCVPPSKVTAEPAPSLGGCTACIRTTDGPLCSGFSGGCPGDPLPAWPDPLYFTDSNGTRALNLTGDGWASGDPAPQRPRHSIPIIDDALSDKGPFPVLYLSGPMSGIRDLNFPAFNAAAEKLRQIGFPVLNPADFGQCGGLDWSDNLQRDLYVLGCADIVVQLPGWELSRGASLEYNTAVALGKGVTSIHTLIPSENLA